MGKCVALGARVLSARTSARLRRSTSSFDGQSRTFSRLLLQLVLGSVWRRMSLEAKMSYDRFRDRLPLQTYEDLAPAIERMKRGEPNVLWPGQCPIYAVSSGTTAGRTKFLPVTTEMLAHFRKAGLESLLYYTARTGNSEIFRGRHLFLGGSTALAPISGRGDFQAFAGDLSGITARHLPSWVEKHLYEPGAAIAQIADWPAKITAIAQSSPRKNITLLAGIPSWVLVLAEAIRAAGAPDGRRAAHLQEVWPRLECLVHGGVPIAPFYDELRSALGPTVRFHEVYPASEAFIAAQDSDPEAGLRLMTETGVFFEFLPMSDFDSTRLNQLGGRAVPLAGVRAGVDYALILTTPAGLCRYVIGDIVRFVSTVPPRLIYAGRTSLQLSAFGEHVIEKELTDALSAAGSRQPWSVADFHVAPLFADSAAGRPLGRHEWWIELRSRAETPPGSGPSAESLDVELQRRNEDYEAKRKGGGLDPPQVRLVPAGTFERWLRERGRWGGQNKTPRCRGDRLIANELARAAGYG